MSVPLDNEYFASSNPYFSKHLVQVILCNWSEDQLFK